MYFDKMIMSTDHTFFSELKPVVDIHFCLALTVYFAYSRWLLQVNLAVNLNKPIIPLLMEKTDWPPKGSLGPIFSEYLFIRFFQQGGEETNAKDKRYWAVPKFQELLMQLNYFVVPDQKMVKKG